MLWVMPNLVFGRNQGGVLSVCIINHACFRLNYAIDFATSVVSA